MNGRKINFITLDDGYNPAKTVELVRQLVEQEKVLCTFNTLGTPTNTAIHKYMNQKKVPMLFVATGASKWGKPKEFPWTMGFQPDYHTEGGHLRQAHPGQRQGRQDRRADAERRLRQGLLRGLQGRPRQGRRQDRQARHLRGDRSDGRSQIIQLKDSGANVFFNIATPKFAAQAMRKAGDIGWKPVQYLNNVSASVASAMKPAGFDNGQGVHDGGLPHGSHRQAVGRPTPT